MDITSSRTPIGGINKAEEDRKGAERGFYSSLIYARDVSRPLAPIDIADYNDTFRHALVAIDAGMCKIELATSRIFGESYSIVSAADSSCILNSLSLTHSV